jgi:hypothetical protein
MEEKKFVIRQYDKYDREWIDLHKFTSKEEAETKWNELTRNGTRNTRYEDGIYYAIFPADTRMLYSDGFGEI